MKEAEELGIEGRFDKHNLIDPGLTRRIQNTALDFLVVAAIALIRVDKLAEGLPDEIKDNPDVIDAYLGTEEFDAAS